MSYDDGVNLGLQHLRDQIDCQTCTLLAETIDYRLRHASTWAEQYGLWASGCKERPSDEEIRDAQVKFNITNSYGTQNWSFGLEGSTPRHILQAHITAGSSKAQIHWQRAGHGGLVPVSSMPAEGAYTNTLTLSAEGGWRTEGEGPQSRLWGENPEPIRASLHQTYGRLRPLLVDFGRLRRWYQLCDSTHDFCQAQESSGIQRLRLVSVKDMCIKEFSNARGRNTGVPAYATLSYVWGSTTFQRLTRKNVVKLMEPHGLDTLTLPQTIDDTLSICKKLDIGYLWIDSLCIIQDEESDLIEFIEKMDVIYNESILSIIAASGLSADSGIPGLHPGTRTLEQRLIEARGVPLVDCIDHKMMRFNSYFTEPEWIAGTPWAQRAWTFQEALVSRRILFFTAEQVYWSCREGMLSEDTVDYFPPHGGLVDDELRLEDNFKSMEYHNIAKTFSSRKLTFEADIMRAYLGTQNYLEKKWSGQKFSWGLPHEAFGRFLMWEWSFRTSRRMRNGTHAIKSPTGDIARVTFPSWSWISWTNGGQLVDFYGDEDGARTPSFFVYDSNESFVSIRDAQGWDFPFRWLGKLLDTAPSALESTLLERFEIDRELKTFPVLSSSLKPSLLVFFTEVATVRYDPAVPVDSEPYINVPEDLQFMSHQYPFSIKVGDSFHRIHEAQNCTPDGGGNLKEVELIAVFAGRMNKPREHRGQYRLYCWPVFKNEKGVYVRASHMATIIYLSLWNKLPRRAWKLVVLS
ncbi:hypothetical protein FSARC_2696 [Fusarium sarcochroum]|uniref:Heterokaryon incompatibility domain-containing protein n=1 Tax=Fusarium sarcochroum TaxID=1208366 RepID=A0A8H4XDI5_9HYPO|nr:hypothetical protein FSARC_2696 [Fusarium sarcochroum]